MSDIELDLAKIEQQEKQLVFPHFDLDTAWSLGQRLRTMGRERDFKIAIDIRRFGQPLFYAALPGTTPDNADWIRRKSNSVARFYRSSYAIGLILQLKNTTLQTKYGVSESEFAAHGGAFPLTTKSAGVIGVVTVSGLPQREDHGLVVEALALELKMDWTKLKLD